MVSALVVSIGVAVESDINQMARRVQRLHKVKHFYDQMDFSLKHRLAVTKFIIELTNPAESCDLVF